LVTLVTVVVSVVPTVDTLVVSLTPALGYEAVPLDRVVVPVMSARTVALVCLFSPVSVKVVVVIVFISALVTKILM
jgi:hypothetical protein